eukprot:64215_1
MATDSDITNTYEKFKKAQFDLDFGEDITKQYFTDYFKNNDIEQHTIQTIYNSITKQNKDYLTTKEFFDWQREQCTKHLIQDLISNNNKPSQNNNNNKQDNEWSKSYEIKFDLYEDQSNNDQNNETQETKKDTTQPPTSANNEDNINNENDKIIETKNTFDSQLILDKLSNNSIYPSPIKYKFTPTLKDIPNEIYKPIENQTAMTADDAANWPIPPWHSPDWIEPRRDEKNIIENNITSYPQMFVSNTNNDININLYIALIAMSCYLIVCDLVMITGITVQPNTIYDKYFDINTEYVSNLQYVGKHASKIQLDDISLCINEMKIIYKSNITRIISNRKQQLQNLINLIEENEEALLDAVRYDLGRSDMVSSCCDIYPVLGELKQCINNIHCWSAPQRIPISRATFPSTDYYLIEPLGTIFVHGIWNFPIHLTLLPLAGCIAAGNNVVVKVANEANKTAILLCDLLHKYMDSRFVQCIGHPLIGSNHVITSKILENEFDLIFFTGSTNGGKYIQSQAAKFMTPVILECGGKNPCFIDDTADIQMAARTICNARIINCGQFCIEPDYVLIYENVLNEFLFECKTFMHKHYKFGDELKDDLCVNQGQFINKTQFERVQKMLQRTNGEIICGGGYDEKTLMIEPTIVLLSDIQNVANDEPTIKEETFGPILWIVPIKTNNINDAIHFVNNVQEKSLALYIFSENKRNQNLITHNTSSGGIQINGCLVYGVHHHSLFGGIGKSGMGYYHGFDGFLAFSHRKPIVHSWREMKLFQPPYSEWKRVLFRYAF